MKTSNPTHAGDCTIYSSMVNFMPTDGICTCGFGWSHVRKGTWKHMLSKERVKFEKDQRWLLMHHEPLATFHSIKKGNPFGSPNRIPAGRRKNKQGLQK